MITSRITSKAQTTIPVPIREILGVGPGDDLLYELDGDRVVLRRAGRQRTELAAVEALLGEWHDPANDVYDQL
ncbi:MAG TPA: AbrB/MazE/SpoVT family DNA-binding domain-containing protein [Rhodospirillaceae bacterium]|nr:AbrB/MazE/SpoVT family DNA-binding domain-containing protein [Rhodospirillaceae bacterium]